MDIEINTPYITLAQMLKIADLVQSGGEAKAFLAATKTFVNGALDQRRGRKLYPGDKVEIQRHTYHIKAV